MRGWLAIALTLIAVPVSAATTTKFALSTPVWTDLGAGPMIVSSSGLTVFAIGDTTPTIPAYEGGTLPKGDSMDFSTKSHVWVMPAGTSGVSVYAAPAVFGPGGGTGPSSVWSASDAAANGMTLSNGGLTVTGNGSATWGSIRGTTSHSSGKFYVEYLTGGTSSGSANGIYSIIGVADGTSFVPTGYIGLTAYSCGILWQTGFSGTCTGFFASHFFAGSDTLSGDVIGEAVDMTSGNIWLAINNVWIASGNPVTAANPYITFSVATTGALFPGLSLNGGTVPWTLQPTAASQKYAPPSGFTAWDGGAAPTGCSQATTYLARATGETAHPADLTTLICGLVTDGVWSKLDALYVMAQQTAADSLLNLISTSYTLTTNGTFVAYQGYHGFSSGMPTNLNPTTAGVQYTLNSATAGVWDYSFGGSTGSTGVDLGGTVSNNVVVVGDFSHSGSSYARINDTSSAGVTTAGVGLLTGDRSSSSLTTSYQNGVASGTSPAGPIALISEYFNIGAAVVYGASQNTLSAAIFGASLGSAGQLALYNRLNTYMTAVQGCPEATAYLARATGETAHAADLTALICGLVADGVWAKLDALYVLAQQTQADAKLNLIGTSYSPLTGATTATFTAYKGFSAFSGSDGLNTGFDPATAPSPHFTGANANLGVWAYDAPDGGIYLAAGTSTGCSAIAPSYTGTQYYAYISYAAANFLSPPNTAGWYSADKPTSSGSNIYYNAGLIGNDASGVAGPAAYDMLIGTALDLPTPVSKTISAATFGASLGGAGQTALYNRLRTYMTAVGVP